MPMALPAASLQPSMSERSSSALAEVPTSAKSFWQALMTQMVVALGSSLESQKSTTTLRPASPPLPLTMLAHALTALTDFWNRPGASDVLTSAIMPILMVVAVSPTSVPGAAEVGREAAVLPQPAAVADAADVEAAGLAADPVDELLELQPAASRTAASAAVTPSRRARAGTRRFARAKAPPGLSLFAVTLVCPPGGILAASVIKNYISKLLLR